MMLVNKFDTINKRNKVDLLNASEVVVDTANFDKNLSSTDTDLQTALETIDEIETSDELVKVSAIDTSAGYLADKLTSADASVVITDTGSSIDLSVSGGSLPAGTENQTLRHNGMSWEANDVVTITQPEVEEWDDGEGNITYHHVESAMLNTELYNEISGSNPKATIDANVSMDIYQDNDAGNQSMLSLNVQSANNEYSKANSISLNSDSGTNRINILSESYDETMLRSETRIQIDALHYAEEELSENCYSFIELHTGANDGVQSGDYKVNAIYINTQYYKVLDNTEYFSGGIEIKTNYLKLTNINDNIDDHTGKYLKCVNADGKAEWVEVSSGSSTDELVKVSATDTTAGYLADKLISTDDSLFVTDVGDKIDIRTAKSFTRHHFADVPMDYTFLNNELAHPMQWLSVTNDIKWLWNERGFNVFVNGEYLDRSQAIPNEWVGKDLLVRDNVFIDIMQNESLSTVIALQAELRIRLDRPGYVDQYDYLIDRQSVFYNINFGTGTARLAGVATLQGDITYILPDGWRSMIYINFYAQDGRFVGTITNGYHERIIEGIK